MEVFRRSDVRRPARCHCATRDGVRQTGRPECLRARGRGRRHRARTRSVSGHVPFPGRVAWRVWHPLAAAARTAAAALGVANLSRSLRRRLGGASPDRPRATEAR